MKENSLCLATTNGAPIAVIIRVMKYRRLTKAKVLTSAESCYVIILSDKGSYLLDSITQLSQIIATMIFTVQFDIDNLPFTIGDILKG